MKKIFKIILMLLCSAMAQTVNAEGNPNDDVFTTNNTNSEASLQNVVSEPSMRFRFRVEAGASFAAMGLSTDPNDPAVTKESTINFSSIEPAFALGTDLLLTKNPDLSFMGLLGFGYQSHSKDNQDVKFGRLQLRLGATYVFDHSKKYAPLVYGGVNGNYLVGFDSKNISPDYWIGKPSFDKSGKDMLGFGFFLGGGVNMDLNGHDLRLTLEYGFNAIPPLEIQVHTIGVKAAFIL